MEDGLVELVEGVGTGEEEGRGWAGWEKPRLQALVRAWLCRGAEQSREEAEKNSAMSARVFFGGYWKRCVVGSRDCRVRV